MPCHVAVQYCDHDQEPAVFRKQDLKNMSSDLEGVPNACWPRG